MRNDSKDKLTKFMDSLCIERKELGWLLLLILVGGCIRIIGIDWGIDRIFQPDENNIVRPTLSMTREVYPYSSSFGYPGQFLSKLSALLLLIYSRIQPSSLDGKAGYGGCNGTLFMSLVILASLFYIDNRSKLSIFCMSAFTAMATMEKWHSAVACFYIAAIIICNCKGIRNFFVHGMQAFGCYVAC